MMRARAAVGVVVLSLLGMLVTSVWAQGIPASSPVQVTTPDGGLPVNLGGATVSTTVTTPDGGLPVTLGAQRVAVEATGPEGGSVAVSGTVSLGASTITALGPQPCTHGGVRRLGMSSTPTAVPPDLPDGGNGNMSGRTLLLLANADTNHKISCRFDPGDGGMPDCAVPGYGLTLQPNGGYFTLPARDTEFMHCMACSGTNVALEMLEESCAQ